MSELGWVYGLRLSNTSTYRYIGQTRVDVDRRFKAHIATAKTERGVLPVHSWIRKHLGKLIVDIIDEVEVESLDAAEIFWISFYRSKYGIGNEVLLNVEPGGTGFTLGFSGRQHSLETKDKIRQRIGGTNSVHYGKPKSEEARKKMSEYRTGRPIPIETRAKMSQSKVGKPSNSKGSQRSDNFKSQLSKRMSGESNPYYGRTHSEEIRRKMSLGQHTKWHTNRGVTKKGCVFCNDKNNESS